MSPHAGPLELHLPAVARSVAAARHAVARFSAGHALDHDGIAIAVSEAVANAVRHAYPGPLGGRVRLHARLETMALIVTVSDDGQGMAVPSETAGLGLGLVLIARLCESLLIDGGGGGTTLTMRFKRGG